MCIHYIYITYILQFQSSVFGTVYRNLFVCLQYIYSLIYWVFLPPLHSSNYSPIHPLPPRHSRHPHTYIDTYLTQIPPTPLHSTPPPNLPPPNSRPPNQPSGTQTQTQTETQTQNPKNPAELEQLPPNNPSHPLIHTPHLMNSPHCNANLPTNMSLRYSSTWVLYVVSYMKNW